MRPTRLVLATLVALAAAASVHAQTGLGGITNQYQNIAKNFDIADKNHDGLLTKDEAEKGPVPFIRAHFDEIDKTHRGAVSKQEVADYVRSLQPKPAEPSSTH